jgi:hypothetical protein
MNRSSSRKLSSAVDFLHEGLRHHEIQTATRISQLHFVTLVAFFHFTLWENCSPNKHFEIARISNHINNDMSSASFHLILISSFTSISSKRVFTLFFKLPAGSRFK